MNDVNEVIFDDDEFGFEPIENPSPSNMPQDQQVEDDLTTEVLRLKGISDPSKIKFEDESGAIVERSWDALTREEQLNILIDSAEESNNELDNDEIELINTIRDSGMSVQDYLNNISQQTQLPKEYKVDQLSDEDLYALDLLEKVGSDNITDEEITQAVEAAKQNEQLFKKTVEGLRKEYIRLQENEEAQLAQQQEAERAQAYKAFSNSINKEIKSLNSFIGKDLELSNEDMEELSDFILNLDSNGLSSFGKAMNDPKLFTRAAFWILNEDKIAEELNKQIQDSYKRGYEMAKLDLSGKSSKLVFNKPAENRNSDFIEDDDW